MNLLALSIHCSEGPDNVSFYQTFRYVTMLSFSQSGCCTPAKRQVHPLSVRLFAERGTAELCSQLATWTAHAVHTWDKKTPVDPVVRKC